MERRERAVQNETEALDARGRELDAQFDACEATMAKCKAERDSVVAEHARAMREVSEVERRLEEDARRVAAQGEALARRGEEDRRRVKEREAAIERREAAISEKAEEAEAVLAMEREAVRLAIGDRFEEMERSRREVMAAAAKKAEDPAWDARRRIRLGTRCLRLLPGSVTFPRGGSRELLRPATVPRRRSAPRGGLHLLHLLHLLHINTLNTTLTLTC